MLKLHSAVGIITNSSTVIYTRATQDTILAAKRLIEALGGDLAEFDFALHPGEALIEHVIESKDEYLSPEMLDTIDRFQTWQAGTDYVRDLILNKEIEYPTENYNGYDYEWDLVVTRNGEPFSEFVNFFASFEQEASHDG
jgi:hypothetical protein